MSDFFDVTDGLIKIGQAITKQGGILSCSNTNPSLDELKAGVLSITKLPAITSGQATIVVAELPNTTIKVFTQSGTLVSSKTTNSTTGGTLTFSVTAGNNYVVSAYNSSGAELWTRTMGVVNAGSNLCKPNKLLEDYTWAEINTAAKNGYADFMFHIWDSKKLATFMGSTTDTYRKAYIIGFNHDLKVSGGNAGITFMLERTSSSYKHWNTSATNDNGISWVGSLIRANCMKSGETRYIFDKSVTSETEGTYYTHDANTGTFIQKTLPADFEEGVKYYTAETLTADGAFIAGLPTEMLNYIVQVKKKTWGGYGGTVLNSTNANEDDVIIETKDWMFIPSDCEVFGNKNRYTKYSKFAEEGETYEAFKEYNENRFWCSYNRWLRSPSLSSSSTFCFWISSGYVNYSSASSACSCPLCFCL